MMKFVPVVALALTGWHGIESNHALAAGISYLESEPNDTPGKANAIVSPVSILGELPPGDQDGFIWNVSDNDAHGRWSVILDGLPGVVTQLDVIRLHFADNGQDVIDRTTLVSLTSPDGARTVHLDGLLIEPGQYLIGLSRVGGTKKPTLDIQLDTLELDDAPTRQIEGQTVLPRRTYRVDIEQGGQLRGIKPTGDNETRTKALNLRINAELAAFQDEKEGWYKFRIDEKQALQFWSLDAQLPLGSHSSLALFDDAGAPLANSTSDHTGRIRLPDLGLSAGTYFAKLKRAGADGSLIALHLRQSGERVDGVEAEPNDRFEQANHVDLTKPVEAQISSKKDRDLYRFIVDKSRTGKQWDLVLASSGGTGLQVCLLDIEGQPLQCRKGNAKIVLPGLNLNAGEYGISVGRANSAAKYTLELLSKGRHKPVAESEPNDRISEATAFSRKNLIKGRLSGKDMDVFRLTVDQDPQLWRFQAIGNGMKAVTYYDGGGQKAAELRVKPGQRRARLSNIFLLPGVHHIAVSGEDGEYVLRALPLGPPDINAEREPNNDASSGHRLVVGQTRSGLLADPGDEDYYRFTLNGEEHLTIIFTPPPDGAATVRVHWDGTAIKSFMNPKTGEPVTVSGFWPPGDYQIQLAAKTPSETEYALGLERIAASNCASDCEYNDVPSYANTVPADGLLHGLVGEGRDADWYVIPAQTQETLLTFPQQSGLQVMVALSGDLNKNLLEKDNKARTFQAVLRPEMRHYLQIRGNSTYQLALQFEPPLPDQPVRPGSASLSIATDTDVVAAYNLQGQRIDGTLKITNRSDQTETFELLAFSSDHRFAVELPEKYVDIGAKGERTLPILIRIAPDAEANQAVRIGVKATSGGRIRAIAHSDLTATPGAAAVRTDRHWKMPAPLRGGLNVVWSAFGTSPEKEGGLRLSLLQDGLSPIGTGFELRPGQHHFDPTFRLPGEQPIPLAGVALHPQGGHNAPESLNHFEIRTSIDGVVFETALEARLSPLPVEQVFAFPSVRPARFVQIALLTNHTGTENTKIGLGEFKAIAEPGFSLDVPFNLAEPETGGHVVWSQPLIDNNWDRSILAVEDKNPPRPATRQASQWVLGFHHGRAAQVSELQWANLPLRGKDWQYMPTVDVAVSMHSPIGPWQPLAQWVLDQNPDALSALKFDRPFWARYLKFSAAGPKKKGQHLQYPDVIKVLERQTDDTYLSVLAEWGHDSRSAIYESLNPSTGAPPSAEVYGNTSRKLARPLEPDLSSRGVVERGRQVNWFHLDVPPDQNTIELNVHVEPTVGVVAELSDDEGAVIPLENIDSQPETLSLRAFVEPGKRYYLKVSQPPSSVVFSWDTSGSVTPYIPVIYNALSSFAEDVTPGEEWINLLPFGGRLLSQTWLDQAYPLQSVLRNYRRNDDSSAAESALLIATEELASRSGTKAVVLITDAATSRDPELWSALNTVQPMVFTLGLSSDGALRSNPDIEQDLLQSWAAVNNGDHQYITTEGALENAFERIAQRLRQPARYSLTAKFVHSDPPEPGTLRVIRDGVADASDPIMAVELILDASGSMLQRLDGKRRINIAKTALAQLVDEDLPQNTALALRVFGHKEAGACRTDLEQKLAPLDRSAISKKISAINARNLAKTPIADSLKKVEQDLKNAAGPRVVILITDGEETCDGDPAAAIKTLQEKGLDVRINIVGFAIGDKRLKQQFSHWAQLGNGQYFDASDASSLRAALQRAMRTPFRVVDADGITLASGFVDGEPVEVPAGHHKLEVISIAGPIIQDVVVASNDNLVVNEKPEQ